MRQKLNIQLDPQLVELLDYNNYCQNMDRSNMVAKLVACMLGVRLNSDYSINEEDYALCKARFIDKHISKLEKERNFLLGDAK